MILSTWQRVRRWEKFLHVATTTKFYKSSFELLVKLLVQYVFEVLIETIHFLCNVEGFKGGIFMP